MVRPASSCWALLLSFCLWTLPASTQGAISTDSPSPLVPSPATETDDPAEAIEPAAAAPPPPSPESIAGAEAVRDRLLRNEVLTPSDIRAAAVLGPSGISLFAPIIAAEEPLTALNARQLCRAIVQQAAAADAPLVTAAILDALHDDDADEGATIPLGSTFLDLLHAIGAYAAALDPQPNPARTAMRAELVYLLSLTLPAEDSGLLAPFLAEEARSEALAAMLRSNPDSGLGAASLRVGEWSRSQLRDASVVLAPYAADASPEALNAALQSSAGQARWMWMLLVARKGVLPADTPVPEPLSPEEEQIWTDAGLWAAASLRASGHDRAAEDLLIDLRDHAVARYQIRAILEGLAAVGSSRAAELALGYLTSERVRDSAIKIIAHAENPNWDQSLDESYSRSDLAAKTALLEALVRRGSPDAAKLLEQARGSGNALLAYSADRLEGRIPPETELLEVALAGPGFVRDEALRLFLDQAHSNAITGDADMAAAQFREIVDGPFPVPAQQEALEGIGALGRPQDRPLVEAASSDPDLYNAAYVALINIIGAQPPAPESREELLALLDAAPEERAVLAALSALEGAGVDTQILASKHGYLHNWLVLGPFPDPEGNGLSTPYINEVTGRGGESIEFNGVRFTWRPALATGAPPLLDLAETLGPYENVVAYGVARVVSKGWQPADFLLRSSGPFAFFLNGKREHQGTLEEGTGAEAILVPALLQPGVNHLLIKVLQRAGFWRYGVRITDRSGRALDLSDQRLPDDGAAGIGVRPDALLDSVEVELP